jgi:ferric-dicitrate binding protein FerR (iron transport regulator)
MKAADRDSRIEKELAERVAPLREARPTLDELHLARLTGAIEAALDLEEQAPARRRVPRAALLGGLLAAAAIALVTGMTLRSSRRATPPATSALGSTVARDLPRTTPLLVPYLGPHDGASKTGASTSLVALPGERARATIGTRVRLTLIGPGRLLVLPVARGDEIELALDGGRLLADYDGHAGGSLAIRSPGAVTTVVGTSFAIDVTPFGTRVGVAHGRVRTEDATGQVWHVAAGTSWTSAGGQVRRLPDDLAAAMAEHEVAWAGALDGAQAPPSPEPRVRAPHQAARGSSVDGVALDAIYAQAEEAMRRRDLAQARHALETIVARDPTGSLRELALCDLARLALGEGDQAEARRLLARLPAPLHDPALAETADHLRCRANRSNATDRRDPCP